MSPRRFAQVATGILATYAVRALARLRPQRWCPPAISLRLFRASSAIGTSLTTADLRRRLPDAPRTVRTDISYGPGTLDLVLPDGSGPHPLVVWIHGGGWHFGDKADVLPYLEHLADRGFAGAAVNYPLAPRAAYPAAPEAVRAALTHLREDAPGYGIDPARVVLAGDSAGAQVAAELVAADPSAYRGALLFCGIYDPAALDDSDRMFEAVLGSAMWSLGRTRRWQESAACRSMAVLDRVAADFPPTFLSGGRQDPLFRRQTPPMSARLRELGVELDEYFPGTGAEPAYHQFQFWLGTPAGAEAFERAVSFLGRVTSNSH